MGQNQSGLPGGLGDKKDEKKDKKKWEPPAAPTRVGKKVKRAKGPEVGTRLPAVTPSSKCKLRLLKLERVQDYLLMEQEFVTNQENLKPREEKTEADRSKVSPDLFGIPIGVLTYICRQNVQEDRSVVRSYEHLNSLNRICGYTRCQTIPRWL